MANKIIGGIAVIALLLSGYSTFVVLNSQPSQISATSFGAIGLKLAENYDPYIRYNGGFNTALPFQTSSTMQVGTNGTVFSQEVSGACYIQPYSATIAASSTAAVDCQGTMATGGLTTVNDTPLTGVATGGFSIGILSTSTSGTVSNGLVLSGLSASSTPGYLTGTISNLTGKTFTWPTTGTASGTIKYIDFH